MSRLAARWPGVRWGILVAAALGLALLDGLLCARASLGRTDSWSFPIDDAYIYGNYVRAAAAGQLFEYNPGERSGGATGAGWMLLLGGVYPLTGSLGSVPARLAPATIRAADPAAALAAGRLYLAAYSLGALLLAGAALACGWLAGECYRPRPAAAAAGGALLAGATLLADQNAIWGAYSGLEIPLSLLLIALAPAVLLAELRRGSGLRWSLLPAALLPWARPELVIVGGVAGLWVVVSALRGAVRGRQVAAYFGAVLAGFAALLGFYTAYTGRPLPSSFYAKVGAVRLDTVGAALQEWAAAHAWQPFVLLAGAVLGTALLCWGRAAPPALPPALLPAVCAGAYGVAMLLAVRWFGQEDRYILPIHALLLPLAAGPLVVLAAQPGPARVLARLGANRRWALGIAVLGGVVALGGQIGTARVWAASDYALFVQNIEDAQVA
ncbi:MAG TPA: hypothetical protein VKY74_03905, partial [Chloroflexia bacterium]|nr:hypothetical protein [Chloroflexia bacterium]